MVLRSVVDRLRVRATGARALCQSLAVQVGDARVVGNTRSVAVLQSRLVGLRAVAWRLERSVRRAVAPSRRRGTSFVPLLRPLDPPSRIDRGGPGPDVGRLPRPVVARQSVVGGSAAMLAAALPHAHAPLGLARAVVWASPTIRPADRG